MVFPVFLSRKSAAFFTCGIVLYVDFMFVDGLSFSYSLTAYYSTLRFLIFCFGECIRRKKTKTTPHKRIGGGAAKTANHWTSGALEEKETQYSAPYHENARYLATF